MFEQSYHFSIEAAHELGDAVGRDPDHPYTHIHGHSFEITVTLRGEKLSSAGWLTDFATVKTACQDIHARLDHRFLNDIDGLERPTLEHLAKWIFDNLKPALPALAAVEAARPSLRERVRYEPALLK